MKNLIQFLTLSLGVPFYLKNDFISYKFRFLQIIYYNNITSKKQVTSNKILKQIRKYRIVSLNKNRNALGNIF